MPAGHQIPKGARVLPTPDWFAGALSSAGALVNAGGTNFSQVSLFNDATDGRYLFLYGLNLMTSGGKLQCYPLQSVNGSKTGAGFPAITGTGTLPGAIYVYNNAAPPPEYTTFLTLNALDVSAFAPFTQFTFFPGFPLMVLAPGWAYVVSEISAAAQYNSVTFWWVAMKP